MFYFNETIVQVVPRQPSAAAKYVGVRKCDIENIYVPCTLHEKRRMVGSSDKRMQIDADCSCPNNETNQKLFTPGTRFVIGSQAGVFWEIQAVNYMDGFFGGDGGSILQFMLTKHNEPVPPTGNYRSGVQPT